MTARARRMGLILVGSLFLAAVSVFVAPSASAMGTTATVTTVLALPYGAGPDQVGWLPAQALDGSSEPVGPAMFQMTEEGALWVLDSVNFRLLEFSDGRQIREIALDGLKKAPSFHGFLGVTRGRVAVATQRRCDGMPAGLLQSWDNVFQSAGALPLDLPDGRRFLPMGMAPVGLGGQGLLISGSTYPGNRSGAVVINEQGVIKSAYDAEAAGERFVVSPGGEVWGVRPAGDQTEDRVPILVERWHGEEGKWVAVFSASLPRRAELCAERETARLRPLGVDDQQRMVVAVFEGRPASVRFIRLSAAGEVLAATALEESGMDSAPLYDLFPQECYQVTPDADILARYATPEEYRIIRIAF